MTTTTTTRTPSLADAGSEAKTASPQSSPPMPGGAPARLPPNGWQYGRGMSMAMMNDLLRLSPPSEYCTLRSAQPPACLEELFALWRSCGGYVTADACFEIARRHGTHPELLITAMALADAQRRKGVLRMHVQSSLVEFAAPQGLNAQRLGVELDAVRNHYVPGDAQLLYGDSTVTLIEARLPVAVLSADAPSAAAVAHIPVPSPLVATDVPPTPWTPPWRATTGHMRLMATSRIMFGAPWRHRVASAVGSFRMLDFVALQAVLKHDPPLSDWLVYAILSYCVSYWKHQPHQPTLRLSIVCLPQL